MRWWLLALAASTLHAAPAADALLAELTARDPENEVVRDSAVPEQPVIGLLGNLADAAPGGSLATAKTFLEKYGPVFGVAADAKIPGDLEVLSERKREKGTDLTLAPALGGVPYAAGALSFTFGKTGKLVGVSGRYRPLTGAKTGSLSAGAAAKRALELLNEAQPGSHLAADGTVVEFFGPGPGDTLQHMYSVELPVGKTRHPYRVVLGPGGELIEGESSAANFDATGKIYDKYPDPQGGPLKPEDLVQVSLTDVTAPASANVAAPLAGAYFIPRPHAYLNAASKSGAFDYHPRLGGEFNFDLGWYDPRFLQVNVYHHLSVARKQAIDLFHVSEVDVGRALYFDIWKYPDSNPSSKNNGYYTKSSMEWSFAVINPAFPMKPPGYLFKTMAVDKSMVYHEYGHHVLNVIAADNAASITTQGQAYESKAIDEGFADFFSATIHMQASVGAIFAEGSALMRPIGLADFTKCTVKNTLEANFQKWIEAKRKLAEEGKPDTLGQAPPPSPYVGAKLFSSICADLASLYGPVSALIVTDALRAVRPHTFEGFAMKVMALVRDELTRDERAKLRKVFKDRGVIDATCNFPNTPIARAP